MSMPGNGQTNGHREPAWVRMLRASLIVVGPGAGVRRWLLLGTVAGGVMGVGAAYLFRQFSRATIPDFLPWRLEAVVLLAAGSLALGIASWRLYRLVGRAWAGTRPEEIEQLCSLLERFSLSLLTQDGSDSSCCLRCAAYFEHDCSIGQVRGGCPYEKVRGASTGRGTEEVK